MGTFIHDPGDRQPPLASLDGKSKTSRAQQLVSILGLQPHPEGGWYREVFRSPATVSPRDGRTSRSALTSIYFLLDAGSRSRWHKVSSDEVWVHLEGAPLLLWTSSMTLREAPACTRLGPVDSEGTRPQHTVPGGTWQAAQPMVVHAGPEHVLTACMVGPGFDFSDFCLMTEDGNEAGLVRQHWPDLSRFI
jgi:uncharacterized protein